MERLKEFDLSPKFVTSDGASNMTIMARHSSFWQQKCIDHGIQLIANEIIFPKRQKGPVPSFCQDDSEFVETDDDLDNDPYIDDHNQGDPCVEDAVDIEVFEENSIVIKEKYKSLIMDVRRVMVLVKLSTKQRNILRAYTNIAAKIDVVTRWNSTLEMLKRFLRISDHLRKASFDSQEMKK
ncbi:MAG: V-type proton ATPase 21 kDa proteolipid subunit [Marteilia pararefringens]